MNGYSVRLPYACNPCRPFPTEGIADISCTRASIPRSRSAPRWSETPDFSSDGQKKLLSSIQKRQTRQVCDMCFSQNESFIATHRRSKTRWRTQVYHDNHVR